MNRLNQMLRFLKGLTLQGTHSPETQIGTLLGKRIRLVNTLSLMCGSVGFLSMPFDYFTAPTWMIGEDIASVGFYSTVFYLNRIGKHEPARLLFLIFSNLIIGVNTAILGLQCGMYLCFFALAAFALTLFDFSEKLYLYITLAIPIVAYFLLVTLDIKIEEHLQSAEDAHAYFIYSSILGFMLIILSIYFLQKTNRESEIALNQSRVQAAYSAKMAALGEMSSGVAHEINTPLMELQLNASIMKTLALDANQDRNLILESVEKMNRVITRMTKVIHALQTFSRSGERDQAVPTNVKALVNSSLELCAERFKKNNIQLIIDPIPDHLMVSCRAVQISQVLLNLLNNAFDAVVSLEERWIKIRVSDYPNFIKISVSDNGRGVPEAIKQKIFEPFFTTKPLGKGTGLGLSISQGIAQDNGGRLYFETNAHTEFVLELPKA